MQEKLSRLDREWRARYDAANSGPEDLDLDEKYADLWIQTYRRVYVQLALLRPQWDRENAEAYACETSEAAFLQCGNLSPELIAINDVFHAEREWMNELHE